MTWKFRVDVTSRWSVRHRFIARLRAGCTHLLPARVYLTLSLVFGLAVLFANPPFQAPDEYMHYFRIHQFCLGEMKPLSRAGHIGGNVPASVSDVAWPGDAPGHPERKPGWPFIASKLQP